MGRRIRGAALRAKKRETELSKELVDTVADEVEKSSVVAKADNELFVLDATAVLPSKKQLAKKEKKTSKQRINSKKEEAQIDRLVKAHTPEELQTLVQQAPSKRPKRKGAIDPTFDLWGTNDESKKTPSSLNVTNVAGIKPASHVQIKSRPALPDPSKLKATSTTTNKKSNSSSSSTSKKSSKVRVEVAMSGQSYNPDKIDHKKALEEALKLEMRRDAAVRELKAPLSNGLSDETRALLVGDTDSEEEDDDEDDYDSDNDPDTAADAKNTISKRPEKLTRAQRNKQKRLRREAAELHQRKKQKRFEHSIQEAKSIAKKLRKEELANVKKKEEVEELKAASLRAKGKDVYQQISTENPIGAPTFPVALPHELTSSKKRRIENTNTDGDANTDKSKGTTTTTTTTTTTASLRTMKPKGSLVTDRMISILDRDMAPKKALKVKKRVQGKRRKVKVRGKGYEVTKQGEILG